MQYVLELQEDDEAWGLRKGDVIVVTPGGPRPVWLSRELPPNYGRLLSLLEDGTLTPLHDVGAAALRLHLRPAVPESPPAPRNDPALPGPAPVSPRVLRWPLRRRP
jgi:hypothetical protein